MGSRREELNQRPVPSIGEDDTLDAPSAARAEDAPAQTARAKGLDALFRVAGESTLWGRYLVLGTVGSGGMGTVVRAFDPKLDRRVAIKVLHRGLSEEQTERLLREARALARLSHPNVVQVYEIDELEGRTFVVMELVTGLTLATWLDATPRPSWQRCVEVFVQAGDGLAAAHARGLIHRDFKPSNAVVDDDGRTRVLDFGLARSVRATDPDESSVPNDLELGAGDHLSDPSLTSTGDVLGTPAYMPLEQMYGRGVDARSDQFSFCVSLYEAVYSQRPFTGDSFGEVIEAMSANRVRPVPTGTRVPRALRQILLRGLASDPDARWPSMEVLLVELRALLSPRSRWKAGLGVTLGVTALGLGLAYQAEVRQRCSGAAAQLEGIWDDARRQEVRATILGTELPYAPDAWAHVEARLDDYAAAWTDKHTEVCEATTVREEQSKEAMDLRMSCLRERKTALEAAVSVLSRAETPQIERSTQLIASLPELTRCDDTDLLLLSRQRVPPPEDSEVLREVEALRAALVLNSAEGHAGHYARAREQAEQLVTRAESMNYPPLLAEAELNRGLWRSATGQYAQAEHALRRAYSLAAEHGYDEVVFQAATSLITVLGHHLARPDEGLQWSQVALPLAKYTGDTTNVAWIIGLQGLVLSRQGKYEDAEARHREALEVFASVEAQRHQAKVIANMEGLGAALDAQGRFEEAERSYREALQLRIEVQGPEHPRVADAMGGLGATLFHLGRTKETEQLFRRVLEIRERALGLDHPMVASGANNLGGILHLQKRYEEAERQHRRALEIRTRALGMDHPMVGRSSNNLGETLFRQGKYDEAEAHVRDAARILEATLDGEHPDLAQIRRNLGDILYEQRRYADAEEQLLEALRIGETTLGPNHVTLVEILRSLALNTWSRGDVQGARLHAERAVAIAERSEARPELVGEAQVQLARLLWLDPTQGPRALTLLGKAQDAGLEGLTEDDGTPVDLERWLSEHRTP